MLFILRETMYPITNLIMKSSYHATLLCDGLEIVMTVGHRHYQKYTIALEPLLPSFMNVVSMGRNLYDI